jgi:hypothetical protein
MLTIAMPAISQDTGDRDCIQPVPGTRHVFKATGRVSVEVGDITYNQAYQRFEARVSYRPRNDWCVVTLTEHNEYWAGDDEKLKCDSSKSPTNRRGFVQSVKTFGAASNKAQQVFKIDMKTKKNGTVNYHTYGMFVFHNGENIVEMCM